MEDGKMVLPLSTVRNMMRTTLKKEGYKYMAKDSIGYMVEVMETFCNNLTMNAIKELKMDNKRKSLTKKHIVIALDSVRNLATNIPAVESIKEQENVEDRDKERDAEGIDEGSPSGDTDTLKLEEGDDDGE